MAAVVPSLCFASGGACFWVVSLALREGEILVSQIGILAVVQRCVDSATQGGRTCEALDRIRRGGLVVA